MYLTKLRHNLLLRLWNTHCDDDGNWKADPIANPTADRLLGLSPGNDVAAVESLSIRECRKICNAAGIYYRNVPITDLRAAILPIYNEFLMRTGRV